MSDRDTTIDTPIDQLPRWDQFGRAIAKHHLGRYIEYSDARMVATLMTRDAERKRQVWEQENARLKAEVAFYKERAENLYHAMPQFTTFDKAIASEILANGYSMIAGQFGDGRHRKEMP